MSYEIIISPNRVKESLNQIHLSTDNEQKIQQIVEEVHHAQLLKAYDLPICNKILFFGDSGCGKTATAKALAKELDRKIITLDLSEFISSKLGETAKNLKSTFRKASIENAVLFIDEFDSVGKLRDYDTKDSGEMKRVVNTLIQLIDYLSEHVILICATNHAHIIDNALLRRFELKLQFNLPTEEELERYYTCQLERFPEDLRGIQKKYHISYAEAKDLIHHQIKRALINQAKEKTSTVYV